jgi:D-lyxose ketol-isomerase
MKRSQVNQSIYEAESFFRQHHFALPPFAHWTPQDWEMLGPEVDEIRERRLGWDVTDFNSGRFEEIGLTAFTLRNGKRSVGAGQKSYAEKILFIRQNQVTPFHRHFVKTEDIINRCAVNGGLLVVQLYNAGPNESFAQTPVRVSCDGMVKTLAAGGSVVLGPGESLTVTPDLYHSFHAVEGPALIGEVSSANDDDNDNRFHVAIPRYSSIQEDELPSRLLCNEYPIASCASIA